MLSNNVNQQLELDGLHIFLSVISYIFPIRPTWVFYKFPVFSRYVHYGFPIGFVYVLYIFLYAPAHVVPISFVQVSNIPRIFSIGFLYIFYRKHCLLLCDGHDMRRSATSFLRTFIASSHFLDRVVSGNPDSSDVGLNNAVLIQTDAAWTCRMDLPSKVGLHELSICATCMASHVQSFLNIYICMCVHTCYKTRRG